MPLGACEAGCVRNLYFSPRSFRPKSIDFRLHEARVRNTGFCDSRRGARRVDRADACPLGEPLLGSPGRERSPNPHHLADEHVGKCRHRDLESAGGIRRLVGVV